ncbi:(2Fe-2S)-binding protein [Undibacterium fentianense]|uniref:(2Fe-2S)-binding protein n=1 Tax=Undibacterium fentianense TaxID=2828728 RepID=A0A941IDL0_9BURK|nr:(2Fe-2S)-binding protein [Undibacterium fentianense]MBR7800088.1 (2Fe-2S)-binding protein [Undibacterium fentianense]
MKNLITLYINGSPFQVPTGITVAAALAHCGVLHTRRSVSGESRSPLCGMGICQECRVTINQSPHQLACQTECADQMQIQTGVPA